MAQRIRTLLNGRNMRPDEQGRVVESRGWTCERHHETSEPFDILDPEAVGEEETASNGVGEAGNASEGEKSFSDWVRCAQSEMLRDGW